MSAVIAPYEPTSFDPSRLFRQTSNANHDITLIILNGWQLNLAVLSRLWANSSRRLCADGGANCLHDVVLASSHANLDNFIPDAIVGDFDSIRSDVKEFYASQGHVSFVEDQSQYHTDLAKSIGYAHARFSESLEVQDRGNSRVHDIVLLGSLGGRVDQGIGILHQLNRETRHAARGQGISFRAAADANTSSLATTCIWLVTETSLSWVLDPTTNMIHGLQAHNDQDMALFTENVGILPLFGKTVISTVGLEWDVQRWVTDLGGEVSTSNHVKQDGIAIDAETWVLFTIEINLDAFA